MLPGQLRISFGNNPQHSLDGLADFSHVWLLFLFHDNGANFSPRAKVFPPRLGGKPKVQTQATAPVVLIFCVAGTDGQRFPWSCSTVSVALLPVMYGVGGTDILCRQYCQSVCAVLTFSVGSP